MDIIAGYDWHVEIAVENIIRTDPMPSNGGIVILLKVRSRRTPVAASRVLMGCLVMVGVVLAACSSTRRVSDGRTPAEQRGIAEACLSMLRSSLTNEVDIQPDDPRVPEIIRNLRPVQIEIQGTDVVIMRSGRPAEYHLSRRSGDARPWVLYVAGHGYFGHQELTRLDHD